LIRRRAEFGVLRSIGATPGQVLGLILGEVALIGLLGVAVGLPLGYWAARANMDVVSATLTNLYLLEAIERLELPPRLYGLAAAIGLGGAFGGAIIPALDMARQDTRALLASSTLHQRIGSLAVPLLKAAVALAAAAAVWFWWFGGWQPAGFVLAVVLLGILPLATPFIVQLASGRRRVRHFGILLAMRHLGVRLGTTAFAVASLGIAVSMLIGITLMIGSFRRTLDLWIDTAVAADVYITTPSWRGRGTGAGLDAGLVSALAAESGVAAVDRLRGLPAYVGERQIRLAGVDMGLPGGERRFPLLAGDVTLAFTAVRRSGGALVSEPLARKAGLGRGDTLRVTGPQGELRFPIAGVYYDYATEGGAAVVDLATLQAAFGPGPISSVALYLDPGIDPDRLIERIRSRYPKAPLLIRSNRAIRQQALALFDQTFAVTRILQGMGLMIAACGIALTLLVLARERASELALYRALGATRLQVFRLFVSKGVAMALLGLAIGAAGGAALAALLIFVINRTYFGWTIQISWPGDAVLRQVAAIVGAAVLASIYPAIRASRTPATELSREE
jgi:putative ABC transport system permease protein